ncbi:MAG TPA: CocE/NonD family hydrolase C-terminal non-catalytic domain-containing protein, partial [Actinomycetota bacterium]|nr:CocE/NonD family hydrolase C-terminal non-catalytic domain-containing protein [Actinomycetota bacterium]
NDDNFNLQIDPAEENTTPQVVDEDGNVKGLVAIVPGHVFGDLYRDVPFPGGIMNVTFAAGWSAGRIYEPFQAPLEDQFNKQEVDPQCTRNTADHVANPPQNPFVKALLPVNQYDGALFKERSPWYWADNIEVPTFLIEAWQDEQVGSRATELIERFDEDLEWRALFTNGDHGEYYGSHILPHIDRFLRYHLETPIDPREIGTVTEEVSDPDPTPSPTPSPTATLPNGKPRKPKGKPSPTPSPTPTPTPSPSTTTRDETQAEALARYNAEPPVQINYETGAGGNRVPAWSETYASWPPPNQEVWRLNMTADGKLVDPDTAYDSAPSVTYRYEPGQSQQRGGYKLVGDLPDETEPQWSEHPLLGTYAMFQTDVLDSDKVLAGPASVDMWVSSTAADTDFQVTVTEIRPESGKEVFVQQGWLRASHRFLDEEQSTALRPYQTHAPTDVLPLVPGLPEQVRLEIFPFAHAFRAGSKIRIYVEAPHVKPDLWGFALLPVPAMNTIYTNATQPSSVALPLLDGAEAKADALSCSLRNQPCRDLLVP